MLSNESGKDIRLSIRIPLKLKQELQQACNARMINSSELVRRLVLKWLIDNKNDKSDYNIYNL